MQEAPFVCFTFQKHSAIVIRVTERKIYAIPLTSDGIDLVEWPQSKFKEHRDPKDSSIKAPEWVPSNYPVGRAAAHYLASTKVIPISKAARQQLEKITSPLDISPLAVEAAAIAFVNTERQLKGLPRLADAAAPIHQADKESNTMATAKKTAAPKEDTKKAAAKPAAKKEDTKKAAAKPAAKPAAKKAAATEETGRKPGVGSLIIEGLLAGKAAEEILMDVNTKFPDAKTTKTNISWYKSKLKREGKLD